MTNIKKAQRGQKIKKTLTLTKATPFTADQLLKILQKTPKDHIYTRKGKMGQYWDYVTGVYVKKVLNYVFGFLWSTEVREIEEKYGQVTATIRLTIHDKTGKPILWKEDIGRADIKLKKDTKTPMDYGNDKKAAITDGIKRCAAQFGVASDIYGKEEFKEIEVDKILEEKAIKKELPKSDKDNEPPTALQVKLLKKMGKEIPATQREAKEALLS